MRRQNRCNPANRPRLRSWVIHQESAQTCRLSSARSMDLYFPLPVRLGTDWPVEKFAYDMPPYALDLAFRCERRPYGLTHEILSSCTRLFRSSTFNVSY